MNYLSEFPDIPPFSLNRDQKEELLSLRLSELSRHHYARCEAYRKMMDSIRFDPAKIYPVEEIPFIPVRLFKMFDLLSIPREEVVKTVTSSGTGGQAVSRIFLDKKTSLNQSKALTRIVASFIGPERLPMIIVDTENVIRDRYLFSARGAGIMGFSIFGRERLFSLNEKMEFEEDKLIEFLEKHKNKKILLFGFTFMVYHHFFRELLKRDLHPDLSGSVLIHGGGWKKLENEVVSPTEFRKKLREVCGIQKVHDYYGMAEQTGSVFMECESGYFHASVYSEVIVRRPSDFSVAGHGETGIIQVLSVLPESYPGHSLLTEDEGIIIGEDDCPCGRPGKYFKVSGRLRKAELRGCSDVYERMS